MDKLFFKIVTGSPIMELKNQYISTSQYTILCAQAPDPRHRIELLRSRLRSSTETTSEQNMIHIVNTCITTELSPDDVEALIEEIAQIALEHSTWSEFIKWVCTLIHYYCTDDLTISLFLEFDVPSIAVRALKEFQQNTQLVLSACTLLSHFNMYDISDSITQLTNALFIHAEDKQVSKIAVYTLAEYTSYHAEIPHCFAYASRKFVDAGGVPVLESILRNYLDDDETTTHAVCIVANITSSGASDSIDPNSDLMMYVSESLTRLKHLEMHCHHVLRIFSSIPSSKYNDLDSVLPLFIDIRSEMLALEWISFLSSVASSCKDKKPKIYSTGCIPLIVEIMRTYETNSSILEGACSLISYLSFDSDQMTSEITELGGMDLTLHAMRKFPSNEDLLTTACSAISGLAFDNPAGQKILIDNEGVSLVIDAMRKGRKASLQESGCLAIGTMCWNPDLKTEIVRLGGIDLIIKSLKEHCTSYGLVKNACRAIDQIAFSCEKYRDEMCDKGVIPLIVKGMQRHSTFDRVQMHGCIALSYLSWSNKDHAAKIRGCGGYKTIVDAMRNHPNNQEVQEHACRALVGIFAFPTDDLAPVLTQIIASMRRCERSAEIQEEGCRAIVTLSLLSSANKDILFDLNAPEVVITGMKNFAQVELVQQEACNALAHLAYEHLKLNCAITNLNGVQLLIDLMRTFKHSAKIQLNGCAALSALAFDNITAQEQIFEFGGIPCVIYATDTFDRLRILELGCSLLGNLAWNTTIKEPLAGIAVPHILHMMKKHAGNALLQKSICRAISQFSFNSESNRQLLVESGVIPLIIDSMREHVGSDKLVMHALKALTYLCWESDQVAQMIIDAKIEEVLQQVVVRYVETPRVSNEAIHLCKILFRKISGSPSPTASGMSPPSISPLAVPFFTPGPRTGGRKKACPSPLAAVGKGGSSFSNANERPTSKPRPFSSDEGSSKNHLKGTSGGRPPRRGEAGRFRRGYENGRSFNGPSSTFNEPVENPNPQLRRFRRNVRGGQAGVSAPDVNTANGCAVAPPAFSNL
ncbi:unnamed protein product [Phytomonas sp. Hart1]|nr:unnamed protein product [Phytomonas sp. Hart1]|eukprot:CCW67991.1 unnamed protein product [Phytomonas sp. isolate Hart1]